MLGLLFVNMIGEFSNLLWEYMEWLVEFPLSMYVGYRAGCVWDWTEQENNINNSFYCAAEMHLQCDAVMGCACTCHEEWDG